jgi:hypothetical protein
MFMAFFLVLAMIALNLDLNQIRGFEWDGLGRQQGME